MDRTIYHVIHMDDTWYFPTGPTRFRFFQIWVTRGILWCCHVIYTDCPVIICIIFSETLKGHNFLIRCLFEAIHVPLEISHWALHNEVIFKIIWEYWFLRIPDPPGSQLQTIVATTHTLSIAVNLDNDYNSKNTLHFHNCESIVATILSTNPEDTTIKTTTNSWEMVFI